jgi:hypothetical protein
MELLVSPMLVFLLVILTPVGTGQGAHRDQLLDPLFPHIHFAGGLTTAQSAALKVAERAFNPEPPGAAFGAGGGAAEAALNSGVTPPVPAWVTLAPFDSPAGAVVPRNLRQPGALAEPPPDPPPTAA